MITKMDLPLISLRIITGAMLAKLFSLMMRSGSILNRQIIVLNQDNSNSTNGGRAASLKNNFGRMQLRRKSSLKSRLGMSLTSSLILKEIIKA